MSTILEQLSERKKYAEHYEQRKQERKRQHTTRTSMVRHAKTIAKVALAAYLFAANYSSLRKEERDDFSSRVFESICFDNKSTVNVSRQAGLAYLCEHPQVLEQLPPTEKLLTLLQQLAPPDNPARAPLNFTAPSLEKEVSSTRLMLGTNLYTFPNSLSRKVIVYPQNNLV